MSAESTPPYVEAVPTQRVGVRVASGAPPGDTGPAGDPGTVPSGSGGSGLPLPLSHLFSHGPLLAADGTPFINITPHAAGTQGPSTGQPPQQPPPQQPPQPSAQAGATGIGAAHQGGAPGRGGPGGDPPWPPPWTGPGGPSGGGGLPFTTPAPCTGPADAAPQAEPNVTTSAAAAGSTDTDKKEKKKHVNLPPSDLSGGPTAGVCPRCQRTAVLGYQYCPYCNISQLHQPDTFIGHTTYDTPAFLIPGICLAQTNVGSLDLDNFGSTTTSQTDLSR